MLATLIFASALALAQDAPAPPDELQRRVEAAPEDVRAFVARRAECDHWAGEEPYEAERRADIEAAIAELRCAEIEEDEAALRARHRGRPDLLDVLDDAAEAPLL
ncbi:hypothetical protein [Phenylobacterium sp.]|jgi:hypothetical protein|uniref:hypothetical protein n=1 Tax=Phenylobacterium sp. TaxID=1871053 RepID=UPI002E31F5BB|nr:hypothetical protein [Phenylobacterium sp.]HEX2559352.1 hypothetical protein [Phenylobacterium sp.]